MRLKQINIVFGFTLFVGFLATGYYLKEFFTPVHLDEHVMRMQIRASHIYILLISLLNMVSFKCELKSNHKFSKYLEFWFRFLLILSGIFAVVAFFKEHTGDLNERSWTFYAIILSLFSVGLFLINEIIGFRHKKNNI
ncbi:MAG: hypothetical protein AB3N14_03810 [Flavobacteriaceae bacterium]